MQESAAKSHVEEIVGEADSTDNVNATEEMVAFLKTLVQFLLEGLQCRFTHVVSLVDLRCVAYGYVPE